MLKREAMAFRHGRDKPTHDERRDLIAAPSGGRNALKKTMAAGQGSRGRRHKMTGMGLRRVNSWRLGIARHAAILLCVTALSAGYARSQTADTVLVNGKILTVDKDFSVQQALAISH
jgi:hypothetical protein